MTTASPATLGNERKGILLIVGAMFLFSIMDATAKQLAGSHPPLQVVWARYTSQTLVCLIVFAPRLGRVLATDRLGLQLVRSGLLFMATLFFFTSLRHLALAEATAIFEISPLVITALSVLVLGERVGLGRWIGVGAGLIGAVIIIRPGTEVFAPAALLPAAAATCFAAYSVATRFLGETEGPFTSLLYTTLVGTLVASLIVPWHWSPLDAGDWVAIATFGIVGALGQYLLILAFRSAPASAIAPFGYAGLIFNALWGFLIFAETPDFWTMIGASVIVGAGLYVWDQENRARSPLAAR
jgi:drug/metabolite transporter (DMT)-like permease